VPALRAVKPQTAIPAALVASWGAVQEGLELLSEQALNAPVDFVSLGMAPSKAKQVKQTLRALGLLSSENVAGFRLRRLVQGREYTVLVDALNDTFPTLMTSILGSAPPDEVATALAQLDGSAASRQRCGRFIAQALKAAGVEVTRYQTALVALGALDPIHGPRGPDNLPGPSGDDAGRLDRGTMNSGDVTAERLLAEEAAMYHDTLRRGLERGDFHAVDMVRGYLADLRRELRENVGPG